MLLPILLLGYHTSLSFCPELSRRLPGIWKLKTDSLPFEPNIRSKLQGLLSSSRQRKDDVPNHDEIWLKLNADGTFKQCNEGYVEGKWISGNWKLINELRRGPKLVLAMNRQYYGPQYDLVLEGRLNNKDNVGKEENDKTANAESEPSLTLQGHVLKGKYLHPRGHTSFFDPPLLASPETIGPFHMEQSLSTYSILGDRLDKDDLHQDPTTTIIRNLDFHGKKFVLAVEPLKQSKSKNEQTQNQPVDIRSMPVTFFVNNTFAAMGVNKILRGRFQVQKAEEDGYELSMQVSLFGAGRSAPGSVYSEGTGLSHEDERTYVGTIQQQVLDNTRTLLYVQGTVFFGTDLGEDARPEPVAMFYLSQDTTTPGSIKNAAVLEDFVTSPDEEDETPASGGGVFE
jgi:hypothetical protein